MHLAEGERGVGFADCPDGKVVTGGGPHLAGLDPPFGAGPQMNFSEPTEDGRSWRVQMDNLHAGIGAFRFTVKAVCVDAGP